MSNGWARPMYRSSRLRMGALAVLSTTIACGSSDRTSPGTDIGTRDPTLPGDSVVIPPLDSVAPPIDSVPGDSIISPPSDTVPAPGDSAPPPPPLPIPPGIVFASFDLDNGFLRLTPFNGSVRLPEPDYMPTLLEGVRVRGGRVMVKLCDHDVTVQNSDGTFNLAKWKAKVARYAGFNFDPYIENGTLIGHMLLDEPDDPTNWGGTKIPHAAIEEMAEYSKQLFPKLTTFVRSKPSYLTTGGIKFKYLDAGWTLYESWRGDPRRWIKGQVAMAKEAGLGLVVGLNLLNGGTKASGIKGTKGALYSMSVSQMLEWGKIMLDEPYACAFFAWKFHKPYYNRPGVKAALLELEELAKKHPETSCRQR
jgi:hypothetical protein